MVREQGGAPGPGLSPCPLPASAPDLLQHLSDSRHVAVYHKGRFFKLWLYEGSQLLKPCDLELQFQRILDDPSPPQPGEEKLAALNVVHAMIMYRRKLDREEIKPVSCVRRAAQPGETAASELRWPPPR